jgi:hypothetical protein
MQKQEPNLSYIVEAFNYGKRGGHRYIVGVFTNKEQTIAAEFRKVSSQRITAFRQSKEL